MKQPKFRHLAIAFSLILFHFQPTSAQNLPTAQQIAAQLTFGWNIGNTMEVPGDPTAWGNPLPTQALIDSVKAAGFNTIRIPCAWDSYANQSTYVISSTWMNQVKQVVDFAVGRDMYVILNIHWDGGWLEDNITSTVDPIILAKQKAYWGQIAATFRDYDEHLLFASANEPAHGDAYGVVFTPARVAVLNTYHQAFIDTVRASGGNNASRTLVIQGPKTDIETTYQVWNPLPSDPTISGRLMAEIHFYPYNFTLMTQDESWGNQFFYWGAQNHSPSDLAHNPTWGEEAHVDEMFNLMKTKFVDHGIPVILGEFGAMLRTTLSGDDLARHIASRQYFYQYVASSGKQHGVIPYAWDTGYNGDGRMTLFYRSGEIMDLGLLNGLRVGWGMPELNAGPVSTSNAVKILYSAKDSLWGQVDLGVVQANISAYDSIIVRAYINGETDYTTGGATAYGFVDMSLVTMSNNWTWREASLGDLSLNSWVDYRIPISTNISDVGALVPANPNQIDFFALQVYSQGFRGTIYIDHIVFVDNQGPRDTLYTFNQIVPTAFTGNVQNIKMIPTDDVMTDTEWLTATTTVYGPVSSNLLGDNKSANLAWHFNEGKLSASFQSLNTEPVQITLRKISGQIISQKNFEAQAGMNNFEIMSSYRGTAILQIKQGSTSITKNIPML